MENNFKWMRASKRLPDANYDIVFVLWSDMIPLTDWYSPEINAFYVYASKNYIENARTILVKDVRCWARLPDPPGIVDE